MISIIQITTIPSVELTNEKISLLTPYAVEGATLHPFRMLHRKIIILLGPHVNGIANK